MPVAWWEIEGPRCWVAWETQNWTTAWTNVGCSNRKMGWFLVFSSRPLWFQVGQIGDQHILVKVQGALHTWCAIPFAMKLHKRYTRMTRAAPSTWQKCAGAGVVLWHIIPYLLSSPWSILPMVAFGLVRCVILTCFYASLKALSYPRWSKTHSWHD